MADIHQGKLDGFFGLYATTHLATVLSGREYETATKKLFYQILGAIEKQRRLTAAKIAGPDCGYSDLMIAKPFNRLSSRQQEGFKAIAFQKRAFQTSAYMRNARRCFEANGGLVIQEAAGTHWLETSSSHNPVAVCVSIHRATNQSYRESGLHGIKVFSWLQAN